MSRSRYDNNNLDLGQARLYIGQDGQTPTTEVGSITNIEFEPRIDDDEQLNLHIPSYRFQVVGGTYSTTISDMRVNLEAFSGNTTTSHHENTVRLCKQGIITVDIAKEILGYLPDELNDMVHEVEQQDKPIRIIRTD